MLRLLVGVLAAVCLVLPLAGCGGGGEEGNSAANTPTAKPAPQGQSRPGIPQKEVEPEIVVGVEINPYFDELGAATQMGVAPGEQFTLYVFAQYDEPYHVSATEFRFDLPEGIRILDETKFGDRVISMGEREIDYVMAFECKAPGKFFLIKYLCVVEEGFKGGEVTMLPGVNAQGKAFLGMVACQPETRRLPAKGGTAKLTRK